MSPSPARNETQPHAPWPERFFTTRRIDDVWWFIGPDGASMLSKGVNTVRFDQDQIHDTTRAPYAEACRRKYGGETPWRAAVARRLLSWGFNTLGSWSDPTVADCEPERLAVAPNLDLGIDFAHRERDDGFGHEDFPDVFNADFERHAAASARELCAARRDDPRVLGWFTDNELRWGPDWRGADELLTMFLNRPPGTPARHGAVALLRSRYPSFAQFEEVWRSGARSWDALAAVGAPYMRKPVYDRDPHIEAAANASDPRRARFFADCETFTAEVAERYFRGVRAAIAGTDPNHLILGCRFAYVPDDPVIDAAGRHMDVLSFNCYGFDPIGNIRAYARTGKPCLIGEFSFRADDSGLPNTIGAAPRLRTQQERASAFRHFVTTALQEPSVVGYHWFEHADQPREGRFDGENSNYGTVTIDDEVYAELTAAMTAVNADAEQIHRDAALRVA